MSLDIYIEGIKEDGSSYEILTLSGAYSVQDYFHNKGYADNNDHNITGNDIKDLHRYILMEYFKEIKKDKDERLINKLEYINDRLSYVIDRYVEELGDQYKYNYHSSN